MSDFLKAALPWVIMGLCIAFCGANYFGKKRSKAASDTSEQQETNAQADTYMTEGMCYGLCLGMCFSSLLNQGLAIGICLGAAAGMFIGMRIPKKNRRTK